MTKIEELEQKLNECQKALAELKESKKENSGKWKPKPAEEYWFRNTDKGEIESICRYEGDDWDDWRVNNTPIFPTKEQCERYWHFMDTVKEKSYEFSKEEWEDENVNKYTIWYQRGVLNIGYDWSAKFLGKIYFKTEEDAQYIIDNFKEELMEYWI